ncbi:MAG: diphthamide biosynthesis enzyme Dph2 [Candidatus Micrarchaeota archaeon]
MRILLQFPEGLKKDALVEAKKLESKGHEVFISSSACFGACDLALEEARACKAQKIIHFGHAEFLKAKGVKVEYVEQKFEANIPALVRSSISLLQKCRTLGLLSTVQHVHQLPEVKRMLERRGKKCLIGKGKLVRYAGQILGCDAHAALSISKKVDGFLFIGAGFFHPLALPQGKPVFQFNPYTNEAREITAEIAEQRKKRKGALTLALLAKTFGILVSTKVGQLNLNKARELKKKLEAKGKRALILISNEVNFDALANFRAFDAFITTACPRLADDAARAGKPILTQEEALELLELQNSAAKSC